MDRRSRLLEFDDLHPVRTIPDRVASGLAKFSCRLIDLVHRQAVRFFARGNEILAHRIDPDPARLGLGCVVGDVSKLARIGCHREQSDLVSRALCWVQEFAVGRDLEIRCPDFRLVILGHRGCGGGANRNLCRAPGQARLMKHLLHRTVVLARVAQARGNKIAAVARFERAAELQEALPYTEPPYWYYPIRQSLAAALLQAGRYADAERQFQRALARAPANGWSYYGLAELYKARGTTPAAKKAEADLAKTWIGDRKLLQISNL